MQSSVRAHLFTLAARFGCQISNPKCIGDISSAVITASSLPRRPAWAEPASVPRDDDIAPCADTRAALHIPDDHDARIGFQQIARDKLPL